MVNFGEILTRAGRILWKHKILWLFGVFASLGAGGGGARGGFNYRFDGGDFSVPQGSQLPAWAQRMIDALGAWLPLIVLLALLLAAAFIVLNAFGRVGLARGAWAADEGAGRLAFAQLWDAGRRCFWRALLLILLLWAFSIALALVILIPAIGLAIATFGIGLLCLLPLLCVMGVGLWALTVLADLAVIAIANEDLGTLASLARAWHLFTTRPADILLTALIVGIITQVAGFLIGLPLLAVAAPLIASVIFQSPEALRGGIALSLALLLLYLPVLLLANGVVQAYLTTSWALVYRRLNGRAPGEQAAGDQRTS